MLQVFIGGDHRNESGTAALSVRLCVAENVQDLLRFGEIERCTHVIGQKNVDLAKRTEQSGSVLHVIPLNFKEKMSALFQNMVNAEVQETNVLDLSTDERRTQVIDSGILSEKISVFERLVAEQRIRRAEPVRLVAQKERAVVQAEKKERILLCDFLRKEILQEEKALPRSRPPPPRAAVQPSFLRRLGFVKEITSPKRLRARL